MGTELTSYLEQGRGYDSGACGYELQGRRTRRADELSTFLRESASRKFIWGDCDCVLWAGSWIARVHGRDPGLKFRGTYTTESECLQIVKDNGGMLALLRRELGAFGLNETADPQPGDVVLARVLSKQVCAIKTERGVAFKSPTGIAVGNLPTLAAWSV